MKAIPSMREFRGTPEYPMGLIIGLDVGSTAAKAVVVDAATEAILWKDYARHETRQAEKCLEFLERIAQAFPGLPHTACRVFLTGSGGAGLAQHVGGCYVQEVNAVSLAVEKRHPEARSVVELGGQDAKVIIYKEEKGGGRKRKIPSMNDKCAGGTGAVIDKIGAKLGIAAEELCGMRYAGLRLHPVAGKCGVFAETDINGLQKQGVPPEELMASLFESIVQQNLSVLTRGNTLQPVVLLLGGPNRYIRGMAECWRHAIAPMWEERGVRVPEGKSIEELIRVPEDAEYFGALGAVEFALGEIEDAPHLGVYAGPAGLQWFLDEGRTENRGAAGRRGLSRDAAELAAFKKEYAPEPWEPARFPAGTVVEAFVGLDGGSTSTKAVLVDREKNVLAKAYRLSQGNPIADSVDLFSDLERQITDLGSTLEVLGVGTTGYAKDILKDAMGADVALVETVAHTQSGLHFHPDADVICDVGGQDIKVILLKNGAVKDFRLNTQCSAGNGYFLQAMAGEFGYAVEDYADAAFRAEAMPDFGYGCAVFMQSDIVDFQRKGWRPEEIMAGLATVLPKNVWLYVSRIPNLPRLGSTFVLQGGTQRNLAAVKAQRDFIHARFAGTGIEPKVIVHRHCGESGAIGCAFEAHRLYEEEGRRTSFIGLDAVRSMRYRTTRDETTRCRFCKNACLRTFIDVETSAERRGPEGNGNGGHAAAKRRIIVASCEKGSVEDLGDMKKIKEKLERARDRFPNLLEISARRVFMPVDVPLVAGEMPQPGSFLRKRRKRAAEIRRGLMERRKDLRIGMPRALGMYGHAPFFMAYFQSLGVDPQNLVWSDVTSEKLYKDGAKRGSIDPCFPSKVAIPHIHNLLLRKHTAKRPLDVIFFPMVDSFPTWLDAVQDSRACPAATATPEAVHAAFTKEEDLFAAQGIAYKKTFLNLNEERLCARQMRRDWSGILGVSEEESLRATRAGLEALEAFHAAMQREARGLLDGLEEEKRIGLVVLGRPYHNDPGINHEIASEFQKRGYPILTQESLPLDADLLERLFGAELRSGEIEHALEIDDVWKNSFSEHSSRKIWAAKFVARHPNLVALELSSFKCGHDAPIYTVVEEIVEHSGTPFFYFKDLDENKPAGAIKLRVETIAYSLKRHHERILAAAAEREAGERRREARETKRHAEPATADGGGLSRRAV